MKLNTEENRGVGLKHEPLSHSLASAGVPEIKSGCVMWQMNVCCCFVSQPFTSAEGIRTASNSMVDFVFDVMNTYCSQIQLFLLF